jgi:hypothetical protein
MAAGMCYTSDDLLAGKRTKHHNRFALVSRQTETIVINSIDSQSQFFGASFWGRFRFGAAAFSCHGIS